MLTYDFHMSSKSLFSSKVDKEKLVKERVAREVVDRILWPTGHDPNVDSLFVNDGTSTSYVWARYMAQWVAKRQLDKTLSVYTNNADVAMQCLCQPGAAGSVKVYSAPGEFSYRYCAFFGGETLQWVAEACRQRTCLLAVTGLSAVYGPCANNDDAKAVKRVVLDSATNLVIVADHMKLAEPDNPFRAADPERWDMWCRDPRRRMWVVTNLSRENNLVHHEVPRNALEWEEENAFRLGELLGDNFIVAL